MQDLALKNQDAATLAYNLNCQLGTDMRAHVQLYDGGYVDAERYSHTRNALMKAMPELSSGTVYNTGELLSAGRFWESLDKKDRQVTRRCAMHLAVTREVSLKFFRLTDSGNPLFQMV
nr:hypothetical protein [uncultured Duganella sp.]